jgi:putative ATP-dependent endonuclease of the OLD family
MKLKRVRIENYRSIKKLEFDFPESGLLVLVGTNNAGKSNIIRAIDAVVGDAWFGSQKVEQYDHYLRDRSRVIKIELEFDDGNIACWASDREKYPLQYLRPDGTPVRRNVKDDFGCIYLGADRTLDKHVGFNDWSLLSKIRRHFDRKAGGIEEDLKKKYDEIVALFDKVEGFREFVGGFEEAFAMLQADTPAKLSIDFKPYTPSNYFKSFQILVQDPQQAEQLLGLDELGEGSRNTALLALFWSFAMQFKAAASGILALEEPELFLHPHARRHLATALRQIVEKNRQVIISTHSGSFVDTEFFDSIGRVGKVPDADHAGRKCTRIMCVSKKMLVDHCKMTGVPAEKVTEDNITEHYRVTANPKLNEAFFARYVLLVEGETEELALPVFLAKVGIDCDLHALSVLSVNGKSNIPKYWRLFSRFLLPQMVMFDNDIKPGGQQEGVDTGKNKVMADCWCVGVDEFTSGVTVYKLVESRGPMKTLAVVLEQDYEHALERDFKSWAESHGHDPTAIQTWRNEAREIIKPEKDAGKGLVARFVARRLCEHVPEYVPSFVSEIAQRVGPALGIGMTPLAAAPEEERRT